jgi:galactokinase
VDDRGAEVSLRRRVEEEFRRRYGAAPAFVVRAPGRVNLIGEHTDYNDGFVLPLAIDRAVWLALRLLAEAKVQAYSLDFQEATEFPLAGLKRGKGGWPEYLKGVVWALTEAGYPLKEWQGVIAGDVPVGAGLSSSAALELAAARAFVAVSGFPWDPAAMAKLCQRAENEWVGVRCGIMDQMISAAGKAGHALLIDCRSLHAEAVPLPAGTTVVVLDTATRRGLVDSAYNERREQCEAVARFFGVPTLRDVTPARFEKESARLDKRTRMRARHVVTENERTLRAAEAMKHGDAVALGELMNASHVSLRDDFQVSSRELDAMVECGRGVRGCLGIRMTGAGFGGCAVALVRTAEVREFVTAAADCYRAAMGLAPNIYVCTATDGAQVVSPLAA